MVAITRSTTERWERARTVAADLYIHRRMQGASPWSQDRMRYRFADGHMDHHDLTVGAHAAILSLDLEKLVDDTLTYFPPLPEGTIATYFA